MTNDPTRFRRRRPAEAFQALLEHLAMSEVDTEPTEDDRQWAREQHAQMQARIAAMRRQHTPPHPEIERAPEPGPEIVAMTRAELLARLDSLIQGGAVQLAHRKLTALTDDDLRQMLAILLETPSE
jgi:uncharacterized protein involved in exopolysaccharide biosynthesis